MIVSLNISILFSFAFSPDILIMCKLHFVVAPRFLNILLLHLHHLYFLLFSVLEVSLDTPPSSVSLSSSISCLSRSISKAFLFLLECF